MRLTSPSPIVALLGFLTFLSTALAIQANLAGIVDWHKPLIGLPVLDPTPPSLVESPAGRRIVSITKSNVLAVLDAENGDVGELHTRPALYASSWQSGGTSSRTRIPL
jgi:hypothetical protein